ncbi:hypothetical protein GCM10023178_55690 [Actinomadura luteofluorescens]
MKPPPFGYHAPRTLGEALDALAATPGGKVLAGGQSLIPLLNMRLAAPPALVDVNRVAELDALHVGDQGVRIGALVRHPRVERSAEAAAARTTWPRGAAPTPPRSAMPSPPSSRR